MEKVYALYKGEKLLSVGTVHEIAKDQNIKATTVCFYRTDSYKKRVSEKKGRRLILLDGDD